MNFETTLLVIICIIMLSSFVQSVTGFGFGLVAMALLPLFIEFKTAYVVLMIPNVVLCTTNFLLNYKHFNWRQGFWLAVGSCLGAPLGLYLIIKMNPTLVMQSLGLLICLFSASELLMRKTRPLRLHENMGLPMGILSGGLSGAFNMGGPPAIAYVYSQNWTKEHIVALLQVIFGLNTVIRLLLMQKTDWITPDLLKLSFIAIVPLMFSAFLGNRVLRKLQHKHLQLVVFALLFIIGIKHVMKI